MNASESDFQIIYDEFHSKILRYLSHMTGETEAEDLVQEVFIKVHQALNNFRGDSKLSTWIYRIATNIAIDRLRNPSFKIIIETNSINETGEIFESETDEKVEGIEDKKPMLERQVIIKQMNECIRGYVEKLPESYRTVLVLSEWEGLRDNEIAEILNTPISTVKIRLHRAKVKLKEALIAHCGPYWIEENEFLPDLKKYL